MKYLGLILLLFCLSITECAAKIDADTLYIRFMSWEEYNHVHLVTCNSFENELPYKEYCISDKNTINKLVDNIKALQETADTSFAIGGKMLFVHNGEVVKKACMSSHFVLMDGHTYICTQKLMDTIDDIMHKGVLIDNQSKFLPDFLGDEYIQGRDSLYSKLASYYEKNLNKSLMEHGNTRISAHCKADKEGNTIKAIVHVSNNNLSDQQRDSIKELTEKFFMNEVKWKPDDTRMKSDWIWIIHKIKDIIPFSSADKK